MMRHVHRKCKVYVDIVELHIKLCTQIWNLPKTAGAKFLSQFNS